MFNLNTYKYFVVLFLLVLLNSCSKNPDSPGYEWVDDMYRSQAIEAYVDYGLVGDKVNDTLKRITIYSEKKDLDGNLYNLYLKKEIDKNNFQITYAKKGVFREYDNIPVLVLFDGETITGKNNEITNVSFSKSDFPINNTETNSFVTQQKTQELSSFNLFRCVKFLISNKKNKDNPKIINCSKNNSDNIFKELYKRFIIPFYILILSLVPLLLIIMSKENTKYQKLKFTTFLIGLFFIIFSETTIRLISDSFAKNIIISFLPIVFIITLYLIFYKKFNYRY